MSLQVWLPLTKDLRNQGLANVTVTNSGATYQANAGKLGGAYYFNGSSRIQTSLPTSMTTIKNTTVAAWVKSTSATLALGGISHDSTPDYYMPECTLYSSGWQTGTGSGWAYISGGTVANTNVWHHVACTISDTHVTTYLDGVQVATKTLSAWGMTTFDLGSGHFIEIGSDFPGGNEYLTGYVNDFRIYNNCLTASDIKDLARGLVLHYPLNRQSWGQENLILESHKVTSGGNASGITRTYEEDGSMKIVSTSGNGNWCSLGFAKSSNTSVGDNMTVGNTYCISCDAKVEVGTVLPTLFINAGNTYKQLRPVSGSIITGKWMRVYYTSTWVEPGTSYGNISLHLGFSGAIGTYYFKNFKLEKGSTPTPWCPNADDTNNMNINGTAEYDCSGLGNNGTRTGTFSWNSDTPNYDVSQVFSGSQYIVEPNEINTIDSTIALWVKSNLSANCHVLDARNSSEIGKQPIYQYTNGSIQTGGNNAYVTTSTGLLVANTWVHIALVQSGNSLLVYKNGTLFQTLSCNNSPIIKPTVGARLNFANKYSGQLSNLKIYATALSAEDVLALYENRI